MNQNVIDNKELRKFGLILSLGLIGIFGLAFPLLFHKASPHWPFIIGGIVIIPTLFQPRWLKLIYGPWMKVGAVLGWINTRILLGLLFFIIITPMGFMMRLVKGDPMKRAYNEKLDSYRTLSPQRDKIHMERPF